MHVLTHAELQEVLEKTRRGLLEIFGDKLEELWLAGSYARGEAMAESDINIFVLVDVDAQDMTAYREKVSHLSSGIDLEYDVFLSIIMRDSKTFRETIDWNPFYSDLLTKGIDLLNSDIEKVLKDIPVTVSFKVDATLYDQAQEVAEEYGYTLEEVLLRYVHAIVRYGGIPFPYLSKREKNESQIIMEASARIMEKHRDAYIALAGGFTDDFMESGREQGSPQKREDL